MTLFLDPRKFSELPVDEQVKGDELVPLVNEGENATTTVRAIKQPRHLVIESSPSPAINTDQVDYVEITAQAENINPMSGGITGTPVPDQVLHFSITALDTIGILWGDLFEDGSAVLPTSTDGTDRLDVLLVWNAASGKFRCMAR